MRKAFIILTGICLTFLFTACKQFTADIDDYLSYWASEAFIKSSNIEAAHQTDVTGIASVASEKDVTVTLKVQNPKSFRFIMPSASETRNIVHFEHLTEAKAAAGADYELKQLGGDTLQLIYKAGFLKKYEWGEKDLAPIITLYAKDGRQFKQRYTFKIKANTPPPKPSFTVVKTKGSPAYYVLGITVPDMNKTVSGGGGLLHKDLARIEVSGTSYTFSVDEAHKTFIKPESAGFITHSEVEKLTEPGAEEVPAGGWVLYYKTDVEVKDGAAKKDYTIKLTDAKGLVSPVLNASTKPNKAEAEIISITKGTESSGSGSEYDPVIIGTDNTGAELTISSATGGTTVHCTLTDTGSAASSQYNGNPVTVPLPLSGAGEKTYKLEYYTDGEGFAATAVKTVYYKVLQEYTVTFNANGGAYAGGATVVSKTALHGTTISQPDPLPVRRGFGLTGWYDNADATGTAWDFTANTVTSDITLYAKWKEGEASYRVEHYQEELNGSYPTTPTDTETKYGTTNALIDADAIKKNYEGFEFHELKSNNPTIDANNSTVVKLYYKRKTYTVTFTAGNAGGSITATPSTGSSVSGSIGTVKHGGSIEFTATPNPGYEVDSWEVSLGTFASGGGGGQTSATLSNITENKDVKVKFKKKSCTVTFKPNGGKLDGNTHDVIKRGNYGESLTAPAAEKTGYTLSGWSPALPSTFPAADATYTAQWTANTYKVRFNKNDSNASGIMNDQMFTYDQSKPLTANGFTKTGYTFKGWARNPSDSSVYYSDEAQVNNLTIIQNGTVNLYAVWEINTYTVTFRVAGGKGGTLETNYGGTNSSTTASATVQVTNGDSVSFTATPDEGWKFDSWTGVSSSSSTTATLYNVTAPTTVTVKFKPGEFNLAGGSGAWERLKKEAAKPDGAHTIIINGEIKADYGDDGEIIPGRNLTIEGKDSSAVLHADQRSRIFHVQGNKTLTLKNITLKKGFETRGNGGGVLVESGATLIMKNSSITSCTAKHGGGVYVAGTFTMEGSSSIIECEATTRASGVYVSGTFTMQDSSSIQKCPEGVNVSGAFTMKGSSSIQNCDEGVNVSGTFNMQDSSFIKNCDNGVYVVSGTFNMKDGAEVVTNDEKNDVYLASGRSITVTGTLTKKPAARITPDSYTDGRVLATGDAEKANFTVTPKNGSEHWRYKKKDGVIKFVPATLTVTFMEIKCVKVNDAGDTAEYYWTMKVNGKILSEREDKSGKRWENVATGDTLDISEESFRKEFRYFPVNPIPVDIDIHEDDVSGDDDMGTTKALLTYDYDNDQWKWAYNGSQSNGNQESNTDIRIGDGKTETFTEEYRNKDKGDTDVTIRISWKE